MCIVITSTIVSSCTAIGIRCVRVAGGVEEESSVSEQAGQHGARGLSQLREGVLVSARVPVWRGGRGGGRKVE